MNNNNSNNNNNIYIWFRHKQYIFSFHKSPDRTVVHTVSYSVGNGDFVLAVKRPGLEGDTHFLLVQKLEKCEPTFAIPRMTLWLAQVQYFSKLYIGVFNHTQHVCYRPRV